MRYAVFCLSMIASLCVAACDGESAAETSGAAGKVVELSGSATATRGDQRRDLQVGAEVYADDVIQTAEGARILIALTHNGARWTLEGGNERRVDESVAWRAEKQTGTELASNDENRTGAAGRHTEREAAESEGARQSGSELAQERAKSEESATKRPEPTPARASSASKGTRAKPGSGPRGKDRDEKKGSGGTKPRDTGGPRNNAPLNVGSLNADPPDKKADSSAKPSDVTVGSVSASLAEGVGANSAQRTLAAAKTALSRCAAEHAKAPGSVKGTIRIDTAGKVSRVRLSGGSAALRTCLTEALKNQKFSKRDEATTVRVTIELVAK